jgi:formamidopyrimidine-DNA glycosylase
MPELPDIEGYLAALRYRIMGATFECARVRSPFLVRSVEPALASLEGHTVRELRRVGKRIAIGFDHDAWLVLHLMIAGRLHWKTAGAKITGRNDLAAIDFSTGTLTLTEAGTKRRASLYVVPNEAGLGELDPGGIEPLDASPSAFRAALSAENRTLKRALTDPHIVSGIGNAYSDEILHAAQLSPVTRTQALGDDAWRRLYDATQHTLRMWTERFSANAAADFPEHVTAFRPEMAVHGRYGKACPRCGSPVQRIRYADNETNYCAACQTGGKLLADRSLSRLLKGDWPKTLAELEERRGGNVR